MQMFSCEYCEIFKNVYFQEHLRTVASEYNKKPRRITSLTFIQWLILLIINHSCDMLPAASSKSIR